MSSFYSPPGQSPHKYFKNLLLSFKKEIETTTEIKLLEEKMQAVINAAKDLKFLDHHKNSTFHIPDAEKVLDKMFNEFKRYISSLRNKKNLSPQDLLDSIEIALNILPDVEF